MNDRLFVKGFTFGWMARRGEYREPYSVDSLMKLKDTGCEWIALAFDTRQETVTSTRIYFDYGYNVTDKDLYFIIDKAHEMGLKVCLKPVLNSNDGLWRAYVNFADGAKLYWDEWFDSYQNFICHYAEIAKDTNCEMYCIGCEMVGSERKTAYWRRVIQAVRERYHGPVTYNANHGDEDGIEWLGDLDIIGISGYYRVAQQPGESEDVMVQNWEKAKSKLVRLHETFNRNILFEEIGCRSASGCAKMPWDSFTDLPYDQEEQARFYSAAMRALWNEPWFSGFLWWEWSHKLYDLEEAKTDRGFGIYGKRAERVLRQWYQGGKFGVTGYRV